ncbi:antibiotic biosynthesis monooxygenase family protein [Aestuariirhabdus litorea]|uniref:Antibiotic biosynthesis monooxygenase n=1 Tax=Aestuariirhabdus litorea TaxID=2528527 RepID=A0A3P3VP36_9GAMM|nr:antibiotic biosynthesis monooxygenase family protein [Aestuariirhabdus litorea]RRJ84465.1 antibiotic biosynthesis monooxygenase [Aestuariirhabdus litorea]RWW97689.1 antibiotic biosynthesis monooxygenase [Endozoicomonadaceae bacterium GTF-13]
MIKVVIERNIAEGLGPHYEDAIKKTISGVVQAPGFISSESLKDIANANHRLVIINWANVQSWQMWEGSAQRRQLLEAIQPMLEGEEKITVLSH